MFFLAGAGAGGGFSWLGSQTRKVLIFLRKKDFLEECWRYLMFVQNMHVC